jgi:HK97 family phage major capsid protein
VGTSYIKQKIDERDRLTNSIKGLFDVAAAAGRDLSDDEKRQVGEMENRTKVLDSDIESFNRLAEAAEKARKLGLAAQEREDDAERRNRNDNPPGKPGNPPVETRQEFDFGKAFVESDAFKNYEGSGSSRRVTLPGPASPEFRAAITTANFGDLFKTSVWAGPSGPAFTTPLLNLMGREQISTSATTWLRWPEASEAGEVAEGEAKPEADLEPEEVPIALRTFAHWKGITRQALEDVANIQTIVQNKLLRGVMRKLQSAAAAAVAADDTIAAIEAADFVSGVRRAIASLEGLGYEPNAIGLNPDDAATLDLTAMQNTVAGAVRTGGAWGVSYAPAAAFPAGTIYVADFSQAVTWFDRGTTQVYMTDSHADFFIRNTLVVLAEARANFAVTEAPAIVKVTIAEPA